MFVDEDTITVARQASWATTTAEIDEYDTDTDSESNTDFKDVSEGPVSRALTSRSVRVVRAYLWFDIFTYFLVLDVYLIVWYYKITSFLEIQEHFWVRGQGEGYSQWIYVIGQFCQFLYSDLQLAYVLLSS